MPQDCCSYFSHSSDAYDETSPEQSAWISRHCYGNLSEKLQQEIFVTIKRKGLEVTFCQNDFKCNIQQHHFVCFYKVIINSYPNFLTCFYYPLSLVR